MAKYSIKFKEMVAKEFIDRHGSAPELASEYGLTNYNLYICGGMNI